MSHGREAHLPRMTLKIMAREGAYRPQPSASLFDVVNSTARQPSRESMAGVFVIENRVQDRHDIAVNLMFSVVAKNPNEIASDPQFKSLPIRIVLNLTDLLQDLLGRLSRLLSKIHHGLPSSA